VGRTNRKREIQNDEKGSTPCEKGREKKLDKTHRGDRQPACSRTAKKQTRARKADRGWWRGIPFHLKRGDRGGKGRKGKNLGRNEG